MLLRLAVRPHKNLPKSHLLEKFVTAEGTMTNKTYRTSDIAMLLRNHWDVISILNRPTYMPMSKNMFPIPPNIIVTTLHVPSIILSGSLIGLLGVVDSLIDP